MSSSDYTPSSPASRGSEAELSAEVYRLRDEVRTLREGADAHPHALERAERRLNDARTDARQLNSTNAKLTVTLREAREKLIELRGQMEAMGVPPNSFATALAESTGEEAREIDVSVNGRRMHVNVSPEVSEEIPAGADLLLNEAMVVVGVRPSNRTGEVMTCKDLLPGAERALVVSSADDEEVVWLSASLREAKPRSGDSLLVDRRSSFALEKIPKLEVEDLVLEEVPDIDYANIGGLGRQIDMIRDAVELPFLHRELFDDYDLAPPKGILLYGPPGCGKTMIAKAVANSLAKKVAGRDRGDEAPHPDGAEGESHEARSFFLNVKGPELLNKYVGETERHIRQIFTRAREKASAGVPVVVFFDEMESLFRTRGTGVSSDVENTIVPQLLSEIDGVESLANVIIIGASNREDMIDPAILRPGRLDVKIKVERPDAEGAREIFAKYLTTALPLHADDIAEFGGDAEACRWAMIDRTVEHIYAENEENQFLEVTYASGDKETLYFKDFNSGAMVRNIVGRAKKFAIKQQIETGVQGIRIEHLMQGCHDEFVENEDLPNTTNPDDWARVSGKKGERIVFIRTLIHDKRPGGKSIENLENTGQYL